MYAKSFQLKSKNPSVAEIEALVKQKFGDKFKTEIKEGKSGVVALAMGKSKDDTLYIIKNGYHAVAIQSLDTGGYPVVTVTDCIPSKVVETLHNQTGVLLRFIFPVIWGKGQDLYDGVEAFLKESLDIEAVHDANDYNVMNMAKNLFKGAKDVKDEIES